MKKLSKKLTVMFFAAGMVCGGTIQPMQTEGIVINRGYVAMSFVMGMLSFTTAKKAVDSLRNVINPAHGVQQPEEVALIVQNPWLMRTRAACDALTWTGSAILLAFMSKTFFIQAFKN